MGNSLLYFIVLIVWGSTWFAIKFQIEDTSPLTSVFYRFLLATGICFALALARKARLKFSGKQHLWFLLQGLCLYCMNYIIFYQAEKYIPSGLVAATFTLVIYLNMFGQQIFLKRKSSSQVILSALIGGAGITLLFWDQLSHFETDISGVHGLLLGLLGTVFASFGNIISARNQGEKVPVLSNNCWSMLYGSGFTLILMLITGQSFEIPMTPTYLASLAYLALFGTVIAFQAYLTLIGRIGPDRAAYANVMTPVIALMLSSVFEDFHWQWFTVTGAFLCLVGNYFALRKKPNKS